VKKVWIITIFPDYFKPFFDMGVAARGFSSENFDVRVLDLRTFSKNRYKSVDDYPFGGGPGMVMRPDVLEEAMLSGVVADGNYGEDYKSKLHIVYTGPRGRTWDSKIAHEYCDNYLVDGSEKDLVFICGRYEGIDERFLTKYVDEEISLGDFVLTGGELAVLTILDSAVRFIPGVLGNESGAHEESFENSLLEHPQYTRPQQFDGAQIPEVLLSGHHKNIAKFNQEESVRVTKKYRPDLYEIHQKKSEK
jgi:tRNA (guanine37-N1)-methyltransferase